MKIIYTVLFLLCIFSCKINSDDQKENITKSNIEKATAVQDVSEQLTRNQRDTIVVKEVIELELKSYNKLLKKSCNYYFVVNKDTLDIKVDTREFKRDSSSSVHIRIRHEKKIFFKTALKYLAKCIPKIQEDFKFAKLSSIEFERPNLYQEIEGELSKKLERKYGRKLLSYKELSDFFTTSKLHLGLKEVLNFKEKKTYFYSIEKMSFRNSSISGMAFLVRIKSN